MLINAIRNPSAETATSSIATQANGSTGIANDAVTGLGARSYKLTSNTAAVSAFGLVASDRGAAKPGEQWHFRTRVRAQADVIGARRVKCDLIFRNAAGAAIKYVPNYLDMVPEGVFHRWTGTANLSQSERLEGTTKRTNLAFDPAPRAPSSYNRNAGTGTVDAGTIVQRSDVPSGYAARYVFGSSPTSGWNFSQMSQNVKPGELFTASVFVRHSWNGAKDQLVIEFQTAAGASLGYDSTGEVVPVGYDTPTEIKWSKVAPAGAAKANVFIANGDSASMPPSGQFIEVSSLITETAPPVPGARYFDGSSKNTGNGNTQEVFDLTVSAEAPANTAFADFSIYREAAYQASAGDVIYLDNLMLVEQQGVIPPYGDGSVAGWTWEGTPQASRSMKLETAPVVTLVEGDNLAGPRARLAFNELLPGTVRLTVYRNSDRRLWKVRDAVDVSVNGSIERPDYEIPFNVDSAYYAMQYDAQGGELGYTESTTVNFHQDEDVVWFHYPLDPKQRVRTAYRSTAAQSIVRPSRGEVVQIEGRSVGVLVARGRQGLTGVNLDIVTETHADADAFSDMFGTYSERRIPIAVVRSAGPTRIPKTLFAAIMSPEEQDATVHLGGALVNWELKADEVTPPAESLIIPLLTYNDFNAYYANSNYAKFNSDYATYAQANVDYSKAGTYSAQ